MMKYDARWFASQAATWDDDPRRVERARRAANAIAAEVPLDPSWSVLDYGAGTGLLAFALADQVGDLLLLDASDGMVEAARRRIAACGRSGMRAQLHDLTQAPLPGGERFDLVISMMVLHHVDDVPVLLKRLFDATNDGGWIALLDLEPEQGEYHDPCFTGHHGFSRGMLRRTLAAAGFGHLTVRQVLEVEKQVDGVPRRFGVFLATARKGVPS
ncbi:class I SAM-dependent DNA methyltransferase [Micropruina sp.]|uniref:class I SAM-dependent DNA methyltransferase n=1 Tax=Micropruina sp. TaxID=2737536 RepID=UPI0039E6BC59